MHRLGRKSVARRIHREIVQLPVQPQEGSVVIGFRGMRHFASNALKSLSFSLGRPFRGISRDKPLDLPAHFQELQLRPDIDFRNQDSPARQNHNQPRMRQTLQRFADRRTADADMLAQLRFRDDAAGFEPQHHDFLFDPLIGQIGQRGVYFGIVGGGDRHG